MEDFAMGSPFSFIETKLSVDLAGNQSIRVERFHTNKFQSLWVLGKKLLRNNMLSKVFRKNLPKLGGILLISKQRNHSSVSYCYALMERKMKFIGFLIALLLIGCVENQPKETRTTYIPPKERKLFDPKIINGELVMPRDQWFHNFKASAIPEFCTNPQAIFLNVYKGTPEDCPVIVEKILDFCLEKLLEKYIPGKVQGMANANAYGQSMGACLLINYQNYQK